MIPRRRNGRPDFKAEESFSDGVPPHFACALGPGPGRLIADLRRLAAVLLARASLGADAKGRATGNMRLLDFVESGLSGEYCKSTLDSLENDLPNGFEDGSALGSGMNPSACAPRPVHSFSSCSQYGTPEMFADGE